MYSKDEIISVVVEIEYAHRLCVFCFVIFSLLLRAAAVVVYWFVQTICFANTQTHTPIHIRNEIEGECECQ